MPGLDSVRVEHFLVLADLSTGRLDLARGRPVERSDRKSTRLNSSHSQISYAAFCLKKKTETSETTASALIANLMVAAAFGVRIAVVPFHLWLPDAFERAPTTDSETLPTRVKQASVVAVWCVHSAAVEYWCSYYRTCYTPGVVERARCLMRHSVM